MTDHPRRVLNEALVREVLTAAGWSPATDRGRVCGIDEWADAGDFSVQALDDGPGGACRSVLLLCRTPDSAAAVAEMAACLRRAGLGWRRSEEGAEFLLVLPRPEGRRR